MNGSVNFEARAEGDTNDKNDSRDDNSNSSIAKTNSSDPGDENTISFFNLFPKRIFGEIPTTLKNLLVDEGFDRLATLVTLTENDFSELEKDGNLKLKLGHKRLLSMMVEHAKKTFVRLESESTKEENAKLCPAKTPSASNNLNRDIISKKSVKSKQKSEENVKEVLMQSIQKTIKTFCRTRKIDSFNILQLDILKSTEGKYLVAEIICICGEKTKVYPLYKADRVTWVTSNVVNHLNEFHEPDNEMSKTRKIPNFLQASKSNSKSIDDQNVIMVEVVDKMNINDIEIIYEEPLAENAEGSSSGNGSGNKD